ncbi:DUF4442 domain-containing protein [Formosa sp. S-31]|uniref:DUF4442 domain-containing protein n=1 Tax=Formosa sp. S-31 TaxID=2790949 RepID=UPI003EB6FF80
MTLSPSKLNRFTMFKLPAAYLCGIRTKAISEQHCVVTVRHRWINQNPFRSMFWAVQGMAAEFTTGALVMSKIAATGKSISMLILSNEAHFSKKATGLITFVCDDGNLLNATIEKAIDTGEGQTVWMTSVGTNREGVVVSTFRFQWTLKLKS